jgi:aspartate racemase
VYPSKKVQGEIDLLIDLILAGAEMDVIVPRLLEIIEREESSTIILGCTELSLFAKSLDVSNKRIIDPLQVVAKKIISKSWRKS